VRKEKPEAETRMWKSDSVIGAIVGKAKVQLRETKRAMTLRSGDAVEWLCSPSAMTDLFEMPLGDLRAGR
jgi:hypothetical protein